ncbi:hypothetical protein [Lysinibacillus sp. 54212]|uniref:hypothetical protein n=1 Tax=Lysinibacillus sp. 54212 TaxID=3119829 RepID=UPI002FC80E2E
MRVVTLYKQVDQQMVRRVGHFTDDELAEAKAEGWRNLYLEHRERERQARVS